MIIQPRYKPGILLAFEALFRRLKPEYRSNEILNNEYQKYYAGLRGEQNTDYWLSVYPQTDLLILKGLRLNVNNNSFQLDTLILTDKFICIMEVKNMKGELFYDSRQKQLIQKVDNRKTSYPDPILQAEAQKMNLNFWLKQHRLPSLPIETVVVFSHPSAIITNVHEDPEIYKKLIHVESLHLHLDEQFTKHEQTLLRKSELHQFGQLLKKHHTPNLPNLLNRFNINDSHLIKGIPCSQCHFYPIKKTRAYWFCPRCNFRGRNLHTRAVLDHFLLHKPRITNAECRDLLQISNPNISYNILKSMNLKQSGTKKGRIYHSPKLGDFPQNSTFPNEKRSVITMS